MELVQVTERSPAFQFYPKDYTNDEHVQLMTLEQEGAYLRLLCHSWLNGSIPADRPAQAKICRVPTGKMARLWSGIAPCWTEAGGGRLVNGRQERDRAKQEAFREAQSANGKKGGRPKKPSLSAGFGLAEAKKSSPSPSAVSVLRTPVERTNDLGNPPRPRDSHSDGRKPNPLIAGRRDAFELEALRLTEEISTLRAARERSGERLPPDEPVDGVEIFVAAAKYEGAPPGRQKCNPANMGDDRLLNTVLDLRAIAQVEREKVKVTA